MESARKGLEKIVTDALRKAPAEDAAMLAWPLVCGTAVAEKTTAVDFAAGVLRVQVPDQGWRVQLLGFSGHYIAALNRIVEGKVQKITFVLPEDLKPEGLKPGDVKKEPRRAG